MASKYPHGYRTALDKSPASNVPEAGEDVSRWERPPEAGAAGDAAGDDSGHDYGEFQQRPAREVFDQLWQLARAEARAQEEVERCEERLKRAQGTLRDLREKQIPELMDAVGQDTCRFQDGLRVRVKKHVRASLAKDPARRAESIAWLQDNGHGSIVKTEVSAQFGRGEDEAARAAVAALEAQGLAPSLDRTVHNSTLCAFIKECLARGIPVPLELFSAYEQRVAEVERPDTR